MIDRVTEHAEYVADGKSPYGTLHRLACERHMRDLSRQRTDGFPYFWDVDAANEALEYAETLTVIEGYRKKRVELPPWQAFIVGSLFGWKKVDGYRRFKRSYVSEARQQGKSFLQGILGTKIAAFSGYMYGKLFTAATKKRQSKIAWEEMAKFIAADKNLAELFEVKDYKNLITAKRTNCTIEALSKEAGLDDGFRPIFASVDELHQMKDNMVYKALYNGTRDLQESLISMITTRGFNTESFAYEMDSYAVNVLKGAVIAEDMFCDIFALDEGDDPFDESNWIKANPRTAATEAGMERMRTDAATAKAMGGSELRDFLTKSMNIWVTDTDTTFIAHDDWKRAQTTLTLDDFDGERCWVGIDLSSGGDLTTIALEFEHGDGGAYIYSHSFMPRGRLSEHIQTDVAPYDVWEKNGLITVTGGETDFRNNYKFIISFLRGLVGSHGLEVQGIGYDKHNADAFTEDLEEFGAPIVEVTQSARNLNDATVDMQLLARSGQLAYDKANELMSWSFVNAQVVSNSFGEIKVDKKPGRFRRIDPVDACIDAHYIRLAQKSADVVDVDAEMQRYLNAMGWQGGGIGDAQQD